ncbi:ATP-binding cassette domain-containing protein [Microbacterium sp. zg.Y909]|uniref:ATP-binding cassette domain-containing protein n=1 Tax=Microbacterium sp. zg.Y909 TaxID=2969413 RepID=UPI00214B9A65|nr:ATP-binding cassette domain-containing protein [Microbacterium sp. zg.Y909]MCR2825127.1 ATP-binding cassette domain-containing protein [Microbacterium sp. zg.Y909]
MSNEPILEARGLTKRFTVKKKTVAAVTDLTFQVAAGELVAFLGPNGAGKSTSLRMLTTLLAPTEGTARVVGRDILRDPAGVRARIGYVGQLTSGSFSQRVRDELLSQGAFYGLSRTASVTRADELIESLDLAPFASRSVQQLSGGQKRRLDIALGLMHAPPLLFLDEPSTGLDPQSRANLWQHILDLRTTHGTTVFLTTHYLEEADRYAKRVMVMDSGRVIADDTAARMKAELAGDLLTLGFERPADADAALPVVGRLTDRDVRRQDAASLTLTVPDGDRLLPAAIRALDEAGIVVTRATGVPPTLDDVFLALTGRTLRDAAEGAATGETETETETPQAATAAQPTGAAR